MPFVGYYITSEEVAEDLGAIFDEGKRAYTMLNGEFMINEAGFDANVEFADEYFRAFCGDIDRTSQRYRLARRGAIAMAGLRIMVLSGGGMMRGVSDYKLGDVSEDRSEVVVGLYKGIIASYESMLNTIISQLQVSGRKISSKEWSCETYVAR